MSDTPFIGQIKVFGFDFAPRGFAQCNGQLLPINTNQALFSLLGTTFGGNGQTNFALPDLRGRAPIHFGQGVGLPNFALGQAGGQENNTLILSELPPHNHSANATGNTADQTYPNENTWAAGSSFPAYSSAAASGNMAPNSVSNTGNNQPHNNMSPYLVINYSIALSGIFPSRN
ncbi:MAG TPA: tail fiber protein [Chitinophagaceae bacterium]|jgi:microcystin-dependent protein|nr:tail fiber protein [Bacteroidia bacterium]HUM97695.1 tail fiber protein [Chitinophagaceae bacterium]